MVQLEALPKETRGDARHTRACGHPRHPLLCGPGVHPHREARGQTRKERLPRGALSHWSQGEATGEPRPNARANQNGDEDRAKPVLPMLSCKLQVDFPSTRRPTLQPSPWLGPGCRPCDPEPHAVTASWNTVGLRGQRLVHGPLGSAVPGPVLRCTVGKAPLKWL